MNPIYKAVLKVLSSPKINLKKDYKIVRKVQELVNKPPFLSYRMMDRTIISEDETHEIPVRIFEPKGYFSDDVIVYFHGGGWVTGNIDTYSSICQNLADETGRKVLSVDYRLAPEHPFPAGFDDCYQVANVLCHLSREMLRISPEQLIFMGDSAGANLVAAVNLELAKKKRIQPGAQILLYPLTYWDHSYNSPFESIQTNGEDYGLTSKKLQEYMDLYCPDPHLRKDYRVSPLMAEDLSGQPKTYVITAEYDPLRDEGEAYAYALHNAGVETHLYRMKWAAHGFFALPENTTFVQITYDRLLRFLNN